MKKLTILLILISTVSLFGQKLELTSDFNYGFLTNQSLKDFHQELTDDIPLNGVQITDHFNSNYGFSFGVKVNSINTTFFYSHKVSGAKSSYSDFSGFIRLTNEVKGSTIGGMYEKSISEIGKGDLLLGAKGLITFSNLELINESRISNMVINEKFNFNSVDFGAGILLTYKVPISFFYLRAFVGFDAYFSGKLKFEDIPEAHLLDSNGNEVTSDWTGITTGIGFSIPIMK
ncbi:hypothetical protein [uncultured Tenacibaculum sp.]|uniref:hypothetical protein n=1 Tax=uncultured Tenacibaculum sp. TaxID=174713 RepID=UPI002616C652|nr:hypothetical protein [uncultured Tenacibaculum sp.]